MLHHCITGPDELLRTFCGSPPYAAPELFRDASYVGGPVDIWALGVLLFFMTTGHMPFPADSIGGLKRSILLGVITAPAHLTQQCRSLISKYFLFHYEYYLFIHIYIVINLVMLWRMETN